MQKNNIYLVLSLVLLLFVILSCSDKGSEQTIDSVKATDKAKTKSESKKAELDVAHLDVAELDLAKIGQNQGVMEKLILMNMAEKSKRLKSFRHIAKLKYTTSRGGKDLVLSDTYEYELSANGDFHLRTYNNKTKKYELFYIGDEIYDRMKDDDFRNMKNPSKQNYWREKQYSSLLRFYQYFRGHLSFMAAEDIIYQNRSAKKVNFNLNPDGKIIEEDLPTKHPFLNQYLLSAKAVNKMLNKNRKKVSRFEAASGHFIIDTEAQVILSYKINAKYVVPVADKAIKKLAEAGVDNPAKEVIFTMDLKYDIKDIGTEIILELPKVEKPLRRKAPAKSAQPLLPESAKQKILEKQEKPTKTKK